MSLGRSIILYCLVFSEVRAEYYIILFSMEAKSRWRVGRLRGARLSHLFPADLDLSGTLTYSSYYTEIITVLKLFLKKWLFPFLFHRRLNKFFRNILWGGGEVYFDGLGAIKFDNKKIFKIFDTSCQKKEFLRIFFPLFGDEKKFRSNIVNFWGKGRV